MPTTRNRKREFLQARDQVIAAIDKVYTNAEDHPSDLIYPTPPLTVSALHSQVRYLSSALERIFFLFRRDFRRGDNEVPPNLRQKSKWILSGDDERLVFADEFKGVCMDRYNGRRALRSCRRNCLIQKDMTIPAAMITRLEGDDCLEYDTIPVSTDLRHIRMSEGLIYS
ncbi:hypothetical protein ACN38_g9971 [Penicillium nordicum]|uniref:Uncharacterized protein n=1 Tax=Penicillium nordicum TaxID=229535 RepID=A0A0M9WC32_9EURO|nr:hypothetical protein ACN38_g9971 [Penicillium nordicum]